MLTNRIPAVSFIQFLFHSFFILVLNPWRRNCNLCLLKVQCGMWWFFILVLHRTFISHDCLFKIHVTAVWINWAVFQTTWHSIIYFIKIDGCCIRVVVAHQNVLLLWRAILNSMPSYDVWLAWNWTLVRK